jgi:transcriptional regulator with XRE-family HTH domain
LALEITVIFGAQLKAGRILALLEQEQLAREAGITPTTLRHMERAGHAPVPGYAETLGKVLAALYRHGVSVTDRGVTLVAKSESAQASTMAAANGGAANYGA